MNNAVHVCSSRDIECGHNSDTWCSQCPKWHDIGGPRVGTAWRDSRVSGLRVVENPTLAPNEMRLTLPLSFEEAEGRAKNRAFHNNVVFGHSGSSADAMVHAQRLAAFDRVRKLVNGPDLDGVLAKIRQLVNDCP